MRSCLETQISPDPDFLRTSPFIPAAAAPFYPTARWGQRFKFTPTRNDTNTKHTTMKTPPTIHQNQMKLQTNKNTNTKAKQKTNTQPFKCRNNKKGSRLCQLPWCQEQRLSQMPQIMRILSPLQKTMHHT